MKVVDLRQHGGPDVMYVSQRPDPVPGAGELLIRVSASGVNRLDVDQRKGSYSRPPGVSEILGVEVAGTVLAGDREAMVKAGLKLGDRVCALVSGGGYAELCVAPVGQCLPVPQRLSDIEAASLPEAFFTVWSNLFERGQLKKGETVLIQGGTSGIGVTAIQMAKAWGASVIATAGTDQKCNACLELGAVHAINYNTHDFAKEVLELTSGVGIDVILDIVAGDYTAREIECLAEDGRLVMISSQAGQNSGFNEWLLMRRRLTITGSTLRSRSVAFKSAIAASLKAHIWPSLEAGTIRPVIYATLPAARANEAHALMESSRHIGKIVLTW